MEDHQGVHRDVPTTSGRYLLYGTDEVRADPWLSTRLLRLTSTNLRATRPEIWDSLN